MCKEKEKQNYERCKKCRFYNYMGCSAYFGAKEIFIDKCLFDGVNLDKENLSDDEFLMKYDPLTYIKLYNYRQKDKLPKPGDVVVTLKSGFCGLGGDIRIVKSIEEKCIRISTLNGKQDSLSKKDNWFNEIVVVSEKEV